VVGEKQFSVLGSQFSVVGDGCPNFAYLGWDVLTASSLCWAIRGMLILLGEKRRGHRWPRFLFGASSNEKRVYEKRAGEERTKQE
jgi:hypothetical protein